MLNIRNKSKDKIGMIYGCYRIIGMAESRITPSGQSKPYYVCECINCGNIKELNAYKVRNNNYQYCENCKPNQQETGTKVGQRFGRLVVLRRLENKMQPNGSTKVIWECICDCGNIVNVTDTHLRSGHTTSCGCVRTEKMRKILAKDITNQHFGKLTPYKRAFIKDGKQYWYCKCECGNTCIACTSELCSEHKKSCGCLISAAEYELEKYIQQKNIQYISQYKFEDCKDKERLPFDFAIFHPVNKELMFLIELQGQQHYTPFTFCGESDLVKEENFQDRKHKDEIKTSYCNKNQIPLLLIKYTNFNVKEQIFEKFYQEIFENNITNKNFIFTSQDIKNEYQIKHKLVPKRKVVQIDINTRTIVARYESLKEAHRRTGISYGQISDCCKRHCKTAGGYAWAHDDDNLNIEDAIKWASSPNKTSAKAVYQKDKNGNIIKEWSSITEAANFFMIAHTNIQACCAHRQKSCRGFIWEYKARNNAVESTIQNNLNNSPS